MVQLDPLHAISMYMAISQGHCSACDISRKPSSLFYLVCAKTLLYENILLKHLFHVCLMLGYFDSSFVLFILYEYTWSTSNERSEKICSMHFCYSCCTDDILRWYFLTLNRDPIDFWPLAAFLSKNVTKCFGSNL